MNRLQIRWKQLLVRLGLLPDQAIHYIGGSDTLPPPLSKEREGFPVNGLGLYTNYSTTYLNTHRKYIGYYLGYPAVFASGSLQWEMEHNQQVLDMPLFPEKGSIQMVEGTMVVKFSQPYMEEDG